LACALGPDTRKRFKALNSLDRLVRNAHRIEMRGESMRKKRNPPQDEKKE
jgi:hypothetical protein